MAHLIAPSVLAANFGQLDQDVEMLNQSTADWIHVDVMDGRFVPNISFGFPVLQAIQKKATKPLDVHLMIEHPELYIEQFRAAGADVITVHYEACPHLHRTLQQIKATGAKAGVALNPHTPISLLSDLIQDIDLVCIMSVNPGFGGQKFILHTYQKIKELKRLIKEKGSPCMIEIDGGVNQENASQLLAAGADVLVAGSFVFQSQNPPQTIEDLKQIAL
ncbi:ribulose-phosphate 3-epimerase [Rufibacter glacialis]|uniref:Ribulose-phosphate 3-epimerase n=1 Tax=Rufibacter glacialis TaxID=1259555 RepID=A0A5M8QGV5_9BACT|nr:ribulose-phosphate 3-epimerase [Rufibacter glacialis]KAA6434214.1 ribulose-phosphate 3-epimerase [Rufibacter glacialis]GGK67808.1 ribulose-phosphate 3-epimerase [Rufibacter glacialis]